MIPTHRTCGESVRELPRRIETLDGPLLTRGHNEEPILPETLYAHVANAQGMPRGGIRLPRLGLAVHRRQRNSHGWAESPR